MKYSIDRKLIYFFIIILTLLGIFLGIVVINQEKKDLLFEFNKRAEALLNSLIVSTEYPVLLKNYDSLDKIAQGILKQKDVIYCEIKDKNSESLFKEGEIKKRTTRKYSAFIYSEEIPQQESEELIFSLQKKEKEKIGEIILIFDMSTLNWKIHNIAIKILIIFTTSIIITTLIIIVLISIILKKPIYQLLKGTKMIASGNLKYRVNINTNDEFGILASSFNKMTRDLSNSHVSKDYFDNIIRSMMDTLIVINSKGEIELFNQAVKSLLGYKQSDLIGKTLDSILYEKKWFKNTAVQQLKKNGIIKNIERNYLTKENKKIPMSFSASVLSKTQGKTRRYVCVAQNITERKKAEKKLKQAYHELKQTQVQLIHSEKMAGIGQLAAGVAHEINNPTGFIINNLEVLGDYLKKIFSYITTLEKQLNKAPIKTEKEKNSFIQKIKKAKDELDLNYIKNDLADLTKESLDGADRIRRIVANLKGFAHPDLDKQQLSDINNEIEKALMLTWNELKYKCMVVKQYTKIPKICCNPSQLNQVFINFLINAAQAIEHKNGKIIIRTYYKNNKIHIEFIDNGKGIPKKNINKIFDPFFTTKEIGIGTGLGLSIAYGIIKNHKGVIETHSAVRQGTTFRIILPVKQK